jgi:hypothetical protein
MKQFKHHARAARPRSNAMSTIALLVLGVVGFALGFAGSAGSATTLNLGAAASFGAISSTAMTNAGADTVVAGDVGSPTSVDVGVTNPGFARFNGPLDAAGMAGAQAAVTSAYLAAEAQSSTGSIAGGTLGTTYGPGVYDASSSMLITGSVTLDGGGDPNSVFIFRAGSDLTVAAGGSVSFINGASPCNVFWKVNSAFLQNSGSTFVGTILALTQITLTDNITVEGRLLARNADVTFIHDTVNRPGTCAAAATTTATTATPPATTATTATTSTSATTSAATTSTVATTPVTTTPGTTAPVTTSTPATTSTSTTTTTTPTTTTPAQAKAAKAARAKALKQRRTRGNSRPPLHRFGLTG